MAFQAFIAVKGKKQGQFKGESSDPKQSKLMPILDFQNQVSLPIDQTTGSASGKRQHMPVVIIKEWGAASPQFLQALSTNETLESVSLTFNRPASDGKEETYFTILLTKAIVCDFRQFVGSAPGLTGDANVLDRISFTFRKIKVTNNVSKTSAVDDW